MKKNLKNIGRVALSGALVLSMVLCNGKVKALADAAREAGLEF